MYNTANLTLTDDTFSNDALNAIQAMPGTGGGAIANIGGGTLTALDDTFTSDQAGMGDAGAPPSL